MHPEARCCIHFQYYAAVFGKRFGQVFGHNVDAANVQADYLGDPFADEYVLRVYVVGYVDRSTACT